VNGLSKEGIPLHREESPSPISIKQPQGPSPSQKTQPHAYELAAKSSPELVVFPCTCGCNSLKQSRRPYLPILCSLVAMEVLQEVRGEQPC